MAVLDDLVNCAFNNNSLNFFSTPMKRVAYYTNRNVQEFKKNTDDLKILEKFQLFIFNVS